MPDEILNATDEIVLDHVSKLQHGFDYVLQKDNLHMLSPAGCDAVRMQLNFMKSKIVTLEYILEDSLTYLKKHTTVKIEHIECPKCHGREVFGLYKDGVWGHTCDRCGHVETTTDRATANKMWVVVEEIEPVIVDNETLSPEPETTGASSEKEGCKL